MGRKFFSKRLYKFLVVVIISLGIIFLNPKGFFSPLRSLILKITYPFQKTFYMTSDSVADYWNFITSISDVKKENEKLLKENFFLISEVTSLKDQKKENEILRSQLDLIPREKFELEASFVIGQDPQGLGSWIIIDKGSNKGIQFGMPVIFSQGLLVGRVEEVYADSAKVSLLSDAQSAVNATDLETGAKGILKGEYGLGIILDLVSQKEALNVGDVVITSGLGSNMPKGLLLGRIQEVRLSSDKLFQQAIINPGVKLKDLEIVFVVKR